MKAYLAHAARARRLVDPAPDPCVPLREMKDWLDQAHGLGADVRAALNEHQSLVGTVGGCR